MGSIATEKPHVVCVPFPAQGHINPMLMLAKLLHAQGIHITFVLTDFNYRRLLRSQGPEAVQGLNDFHFASIPDGLPYSDEDATQNVPDLCASTMKNCLSPFLSLLCKLNGDATSGKNPPISGIVSDGVMTFTLDAARELGIPEVLFWTTSACGFLAYLRYQLLVDRNLLPLKKIEDFTNGFLSTEVGSVQGLIKGMRLKDFPSFLHTTDGFDTMIDFVLHETKNAPLCSAIVLNTFEELEITALATLRKILPPIYTVGPLSLLTKDIVPSDSPLTMITTSLWKEDTTCFNWLDGKQPNTVVYVNFGSVTVMNNNQLLEFAWGLANSQYPFVWVIRPDLVRGESKVLPSNLTEEIKERGLMTGWCPQAELLGHPAVGLFLTHSGWNSTLESLCSGVPMLCWPFFAEQATNCKYSCTEWGVGMEIDGNVKREEVEGLIREMMDGDKGSKMRKKAFEWKEVAIKATKPLGSSRENLERVSKHLIRSNST